MDDHKKNMIQQWVECQSRINPQAPRVPPCHPQGLPYPAAPTTAPKKGRGTTEPEPFAWLNNPNHEDDNGCKMLTQFKTADSSEESFSDDQIDYR